jgi:hypothetical protein
MERLDEFEARWHQEAEAVLTGMKEWRLQHPRATLREIEAAVDGRLDVMRARLVEDLALASRAAALGPRQAGAAPRCPTCDVPLAGRGQHERQVVTQGGQVLRLRREHGVCPACGAGRFPPG